MERLVKTVIIVNTLQEKLPALIMNSFAEHNAKKSCPRLPSSPQNRPWPPSVFANGRSLPAQQTPGQWSPEGLHELLCLGLLLELLQGLGKKWINWIKWWKKSLRISKMTLSILHISLCYLLWPRRVIQLGKCLQPTEEERLAEHAPLYCQERCGASLCLRQ